MSQQITDIRIVQGKPGSTTEGQTFIVMRSTQQRAIDLISAAGAQRSGAKGDLEIWRLPEAWSQKEIADLRLEALAAENGSVAPVEGEIPAAEPAAIIASEQSPAPEKTVTSKGTPAMLGMASHGYRPGMSIAECDSCRIPVPPGTVSVGDQIDAGGSPREIIALSPVLTIASDRVEDMQARFPDMEIVRDMTYQFAMWAYTPAHHPKSELEPASP